MTRPRLARLSLPPLLALALAALTVLAAPAAADEAQARRLMELARIDAVLTRFSVEGRKGWEGQTAELPDHVRRGLADAWTRRFDPGDMADEMVAALAEGLSGAELDALVAAYATDAARRITALEVAAQSEAAREDREAASTALLDRMRDQDDPRLAQHARLEAATDAVDVGVTVTLNVAYAMMSAMMGSERFPQVLDDASLLAVVGSFEPGIREAARTEVARSMAWTYQDLTVEELSAYADRLERPEARALNRVFSATLERMLVDRSRLFGQEAMEATGARDI